MIPIEQDVPVPPTFDNWETLTREQLIATCRLLQIGLVESVQLVNKLKAQLRSEREATRAFSNDTNVLKSQEK